MTEYVTIANLLVLLAGVAIGVAAGYFGFPQIRQARVLREQLEQALKQHEEYRASVNAHFRKTADLVGEMTRSYAAVYDHLASGARSFCDDKATDAGSRVPFDPLPGVLASPVIETTADEAAAPQAVETPPAAAAHARADGDVATGAQARSAEGEAPSAKGETLSAEGEGSSAGGETPSAEGEAPSADDATARSAAAA